MEFLAWWLLVGANLMVRISMEIEARGLEVVDYEERKKKEDCEYMVTFGGSEFDGKGVDGNRGMWVGGGIKH